MHKQLLANIFCDGAILQRDRRNKIWGWRDIGEKPIVVRLFKNVNRNPIITDDREGVVSLDCTDDAFVTKVDKDGRWELEIPPYPAGGPYTLKVSTENASQTIQDIYFGEVWICGGQSNMELPMSRVRRMFPDEISKGDNPFIRQFAVPLDYNFDGPVSDVNSSSWEKAKGENIESFSAVGYFFAKKLYEKLQVPIGLVMVAVGGTPVEAWMSEEMLVEFPEAIALLETCQEEGYVEAVKLNEEKQSNQWYETLNHMDIGFLEKWYEPDFSDELWNTTTLDFPWDEKEELKGSGVVWFRSQLDIPEELAYQSASLLLGCIVDGDVVYINGEKVGSTDYRYPPRDYPLTHLKVGLNTIVIRVIVTQGLGGFVRNKPYKLLWEDGREISLNGSWKYKRSLSCKDAPGTTFFQYKPTGTYNNMVAPLVDFGIQGVIWYQGESNTGVPKGYEKKFGRMIEGWRQQFKQGDFPFLFVQLTNYSPKGGRLNWAALREEQRKASLSVPNTSMVVSYDVGEEFDLHPLDKKTIGERLALAALKKAYGFNVVASGPTVKEIYKKKNAIVLSFDHVGGGLSINKKRIGQEHFISNSEISGQKGTVSNCEDQDQECPMMNQEYAGGFSMWIREVELPLQATLSKDQVVLSSPKIMDATRISYAWADHPETANLYNKDGLPAQPFMLKV